MAEGKASSAPEVLAPRQSYDAEAESFLGGPAGGGGESTGRARRADQGERGERTHSATIY